MSWSGKVSIVTGATSGLGLHIACALCEAGSSAVLVSRGEAKLTSVVKELTDDGGDARGIVADVTNEESVASLVAQTLDHYGRLDLLVNCVGVSMRAAVLDTTPEDFERLMNLNLLSAVRCTRATAAELIKYRGSIVNIGSLSGKTASRFLGAYPASKFALSAYTQQLRLELESQGLHVLLVCPGPIRRDDAGARYDTPASTLPEEARKPGGGVKLSAIDPAWLAQRILRACEKRQPELIVPGKARWLFALQQLWPSLGDWILRRKT